MEMSQPGHHIKVNFAHHPYSENICMKKVHNYTIFIYLVQ